MHIDKHHGLISDWAQRRQTPSADDLEQRLPGNDGSVLIKLPVLKLVEALEGGWFHMQCTWLLTLVSAFWWIAV